MKKLSIVAAMAIAAASFTACNNGTPTASLKTDVDSVSYAIGVAQTQGFKEYLVAQLGVDTAYIDDFFRGVCEAAMKDDDNKKEAAYYAGLQLGSQLGQGMKRSLNYELFQDDSTQTMSMKNFLAGFVGTLKGEKQMMTVEEAQQSVQPLIDQIKARSMEKLYGDNKKAGEQFLAENAKKDGVQVLPSGVQYKVIKMGDGKCPADTSMITCNYEGRLINDSIFDSSYQRNKPMTVRLNSLIKGWAEAMKQMPAGSTWEVYIPQELAYGPRQQGPKIKPFSALVFKIELLEVK